MRSVLSTKELQLKRRGFGPLSLDFWPGEIVLLCGTSGSGKSTLCQLLSGTQDPSDGCVELGTTRVGYVAHEFENQLVGSTVEEELLIGSRATSDKSEDTGLAALRLLEEPLGDCLSKDPHKLSTAFQQYLLVASLLRSGAEFLILDESMAYLDSATRRQFSEALRALAAEGATILLVSHQQELLELCSRVIFMERGEAAFVGTVEEFRASYFERAGFRTESARDSLMSRLADFPEEAEDDLRLQAKEHCLRLPSQTSLVLGGFSGSGSSWALNSLMGLNPDPGWSVSPSGDDCLLRQHVAPSFWRSTCAAELQASRGAFGPLSRGVEEAVMNSIPAAWLEKAPWHLSHGQLRFFGASCLLMQMPRVLFLDHPFQGLDGILREKLRYSLSEYLKADGRVVLTTHFEEQVKRLGHQAIWLEGFKISWLGRSTDFSLQQAFI